MFNEIVVQKEALQILNEFKIDYTHYEAITIHWILYKQPRRLFIMQAKREQKFSTVFSRRCSFHTKSVGHCIKLGSSTPRKASC
jgi:hypothetical protein